MVIVAVVGAWVDLELFPLLMGDEAREIESLLDLLCRPAIWERSGYGLRLEMIEN